MSTKKKMRHPSAYTKQILALIDEYESETGDKSGDLMRVARWLRDEDRMDPPKYDPVKALAKVLANASRQDYVADENGEPVRRRHCYVASPASNDEQKVFSWFKIEEATPEKMKLSVNYRRNGTLLDILQLVRDVNFYNKNYNPGDAIPVDANFQPDVDELSLPAEYQDEPDSYDDDDES
jgi:hypothetical protein